MSSRRSPSLTGSQLRNLSIEPLSKPIVCRLVSSRRRLACALTVCCVSTFLLHSLASHSPHTQHTHTLHHTYKKTRTTTTIFDLLLCAIKSKSLSAAFSENQIYLTKVIVNNLPASPAPVPGKSQVSFASRFRSVGWPPLRRPLLDEEGEDKKSSREDRDDE